MPELDLNMSFEEAEQAAKEEFAALPNATYEYQIVSAEHLESKASGRPQIKWTLRVINNAEFNGRYIMPYYTPLPWVNPTTGQQEVSGIGLLVNICTNCGLPWSGGKITTEDYAGRTGFVTTKQKPKQELGPEGKYVDVVPKEMLTYVDKFPTK